MDIGWFYPYQLSICLLVHFDVLFINFKKCSRFLIFIVLNHFQFFGMFFFRGGERNGYFFNIYFEPDKLREIPQLFFSHPNHSPSSQKFWRNKKGTACRRNRMCRLVYHAKCTDISMWRKVFNRFAQYADNISGE